MRRFGVNVDDSAGLPLHNRAAGIFARLAVRQAYAPADPSITVALLKHPLACFGTDDATARKAAQALELAGLRGALEPLKNGLFSRCGRTRHRVSCERRSPTCSLPYNGSPMPTGTMPRGWPKSWMRSSQVVPTTPLPSPNGHAGRAPSFRHAPARRTTVSTIWRSGYRGRRWRTFSTNWKRRTTACRSRRPIGRTCSRP